MTAEKMLKIGSLAAQAKVNVQTIRYYERCGLLEPPQRTSSGYRLYPEASVRRIRFIKNTQSLGFSLAEIGELLDLRADRRKTCRGVRTMFQSKISDLEHRMADIRSTHANLTKLVKSCRRISQANLCPIIDALDSGEVPGLRLATSRRAKAG